LRAGTTIRSRPIDFDMPRKWGIAVAGILLICGVIIYVAAPGVLRGKTDTHDWLEPANDKVPADAACEPDALEQVRPGGMAFLLGKAATWEQSGLGPRPVLTVGSCVATSVEMDGDKVALNAEIYDGTELVARIDKNEFRAVPGKLAYQTRSPDRSRLTVFNNEGKKLLDVAHLNKKTVQITGTFSCSDGVNVVVNEHDLPVGSAPGVPDFKFQRACLIGTGGHFATKTGWSAGKPPPGALWLQPDGTMRRP
jgi:hypothetical protein